MPKELFELIQPRTDVREGTLTDAVFAASLDDVVADSGPDVYRDAAAFFASTYPSDGLRSLMNEALGRAGGIRPDSAPVIRLETNLGGGKTHNLIALYHAAKGRLERNNAAEFMDPKLLPAEPIKQMAILVGTAVGATSFPETAGITPRTVWGYLALQLGGPDAYEKVRSDDEGLTAPGALALRGIIGEGPTLILLDEFARYLATYPMRVEQRIGRIDRIGQRSPIVTVRNYVVPGTVEEQVYQALAERIDDFSELVGKLQPILGATEEAFRRIFRAPRSERESAVSRELHQLESSISELERSGIEINLEDPMPIPKRPAALVTLDDLRIRMRDELGLHFALATFDPSRASRDPENWTSLVTYGHPDLQTSLEELTEGWDTESGALVIHEEAAGVASVVRADRTPPQPLRQLAEIDGLGQPYARGEADELAARIARDEVQRRRQWKEQLLRRQRNRWEQQVRARFKQLVQETIVAELVLSDSAPDEVDPTAVWLRLGTDAMNGWSYAEAFRKRLQIPLSELVPRHLGEELPTQVTKELRDRRRTHGADLLQLMTVWADRMGLN